MVRSFSEHWWYDASCTNAASNTRLVTTGGPRRDGVTTERTDVVVREEASPSEPAATTERTTGTAVPGLGVVEGLVALAVAAVKVR